MHWNFIFRTEYQKKYKKGKKRRNKSRIAALNLSIILQNCHSAKFAVDPTAIQNKGFERLLLEAVAAGILLSDCRLNKVI